METTKSVKLVCSFCGMSETFRDYIIGGKLPGVHICDQCIDEASQQLYYARVLAAHTHQDMVH